MSTASPCIFCAFRAISLRNGSRVSRSAGYRLKGRRVHSSATRPQSQNAAFQTQDSTTREEHREDPQTDNRRQQSGVNWYAAPTPTTSKWSKTNANSNNFNSPQQNNAHHRANWAPSSQPPSNAAHQLSSQLNIAETSSAHMNWPNAQEQRQQNLQLQEQQQQQQQQQPQHVGSSVGQGYQSRVNETSHPPSSSRHMAPPDPWRSSVSYNGSSWTTAESGAAAAPPPQTSSAREPDRPPWPSQSPWATQSGQSPSATQSSQSPWATKSNQSPWTSQNSASTSQPTSSSSSSPPPSPPGKSTTNPASAPTMTNYQSYSNPAQPAPSGLDRWARRVPQAKSSSAELKTPPQPPISLAQGEGSLTNAWGNWEDPSGYASVPQSQANTAAPSDSHTYQPSSGSETIHSAASNSRISWAPIANPWTAASKDAPVTWGSTSNALSQDSHQSETRPSGPTWESAPEPALGGGYGMNSNETKSQMLQSINKDQASASEFQPGPPGGAAPTGWGAPSSQVSWGTTADSPQGGGPFAQSDQSTLNVKPTDSTSLATSASTVARDPQARSEFASGTGKWNPQPQSSQVQSQNNIPQAASGIPVLESPSVAAVHSQEFSYQKAVPAEQLSDSADMGNWAPTVEPPRKWGSYSMPSDSNQETQLAALAADIVQPNEPSGKPSDVNLSGGFRASSNVSLSFSTPRATNWGRATAGESPKADSSSPMNWGTSGGTSVVTPKYHVDTVSFAPEQSETTYHQSVLAQPSEFSSRPGGFRNGRRPRQQEYVQREREQFESLVRSTPSTAQDTKFRSQSMQRSGGLSWSQPSKEQEGPLWTKQSQDQPLDPWAQKPQNGQPASYQLQHEPQEVQYTSWIEQNAAARAYGNSRGASEFDMEESDNYGYGGGYRQSRQGMRDDDTMPSRGRRDYDDGNYRKKKKDFKSRDREKHGRGFITDSQSIEEEMRYMMAVQQARKQQSVAHEVRKLPEVWLPEYISVGNLAHLLKVHLDPFMVKLKELGFEETNSEYVLNAENAGLIAMEYNYDPKVDTSAVDDLFARPQPGDKSVLPLRPPVVTIMGHVDHGKTTILDWLRKSSIAAGEAGGITQHIGAFSVPMPSGQIITFLDTPGHAAFLTMRERGANVTDIVILVVAADDGVMPQTIEAIKHAKAAKVPIIVAINKCDKEDADLETIKGDLGRHGLELEEFGGETQMIKVSGLTGLGMEDLQEATVLLSEVLDMRADPTGPCEGWVIESATKRRGRVATILVRCGTLKVGDVLVAGTSWTRVKTLIDENGNELAFASPGMPVEIDGWRNTPVAGDEVLEAPTEDKAKSVVDFRNFKLERLRQASDMEAINEARRKDRERIEREAWAAEQAKLGIEVKEEAPAEEGPKLITVPFIVKGDVYGSVEAVCATILSIGNDEIQSRIVRSGVGQLSQSDVDFAETVGASCITFNVPTDPAVEAVARAAKIEIIEHDIIYRMEVDIKERMSQKLPPKITRTVTGEADVAQIFEYNIRGRNFIKIAGCKVRNGTVKRGSKVRVLRKKEIIYDGLLTTLKHGKKEAPFISNGMECGISFDKWEGFKEGDSIQCYDETSTPRTLE